MDKATLNESGTMPSRMCIGCGKPIPFERLVAVPGALHCVPCLRAKGDAPKVKGTMVYDQKTGGRCEVMSPEAYQRLHSLPDVIDSRLSRL
jgi:hypothetical protein